MGVQIEGGVPCQAAAIALTGTSGLGRFPVLGTGRPGPGSPGLFEPFRSLRSVDCPLQKSFVSGHPKGLDRDCVYYVQSPASPDAPQIVGIIKLTFHPFCSQSPFLTFAGFSHQLRGSGRQACALGRGPPPLWVWGQPHAVQLCPLSPGSWCFCGTSVTTSTRC